MPVETRNSSQQGTAATTSKVHGPQTTKTKGAAGPSSSLPDRRSCDGKMKMPAVDNGLGEASLAAKVAVLEAALKGCQAEIAATNQKLATTEHDLTQAKAEIAALRSTLAHQAQAVEEAKDLAVAANKGVEAAATGAQFCSDQVDVRLRAAEDRAQATRTWAAVVAGAGAGTGTSRFLAEIQRSLQQAKARNVVLRGSGITAELASKEGLHQLGGTLAVYTGVPKEQLLGPEAPTVIKRPTHEHGGMVRFVMLDMAARHALFKQRQELKRQNITLDDDLTEQEIQLRRQLAPAMKDMHAGGRHVSWRRARIVERIKDATGKVIQVRDVTPSDHLAQPLALPTISPTRSRSGGGGGDRTAAATPVARPSGDAPAASQTASPRA